MRMLKKWLKARTPTRPTEITIDGVAVAIVRKRIKNIYLRVDRRQGRVRLSAPVASSEDELTSIIRQRLDWIKRHQALAAAAPPVVRPRFVSGETHYHFGRPLQLEIVEREIRSCRVVHSPPTLELHIRRRSRFDERQHAIREWYRRELRAVIPSMIEKWQPVLGVRVAEWHVKRMRTRWGTCNIRARRIWLSLELAKHPLECLEYVVVHEMAHLLERRHNARFKSLMDGFLPDWRDRQRTLGGRHLGHYKQGDADDDQIDTCD